MNKLTTAAEGKHLDARKVASMESKVTALLSRTYYTNYMRY